MIAIRVRGALAAKVRIEGRESSSGRCVRLRFATGETFTYFLKLGSFSASHSSALLILQRELALDVVQVEAKDGAKSNDVVALSGAEPDEDGDAGGRVLSSQRYIKTFKTKREADPPGTMAGRGRLQLESGDKDTVSQKRGSSALPVSLFTVRAARILGNAGRQPLHAHILIDFQLHLQGICRGLPQS